MACIIPGGIIQITGEFDVGKTSMALECGYHPKEIIFIDDDVKGKATVKQLIDDGLNFAKYIDFTERTKDKAGWDVYQETIKLIKEIADFAKNNQVKVVIWDTWTRAGESFIEYVRKYPERFVEANAKGNYWPGDSAIITGNQYKFAALHEAAILNDLQNTVPLIFLITHIKNNYDTNGIRTGVKAASSKTLNRVPYFRIWLRRNPHSAIPTGLVMKRINKKIYDDNDGALRTISILPSKLIPNIVLPEEGNVTHNDKSLWDTIARYYEHPAGLRNPLDSEIPDEEENAILSGTMTKEQRIAWLYAIKEKHDLEESMLEDGNREMAIALKAEGKTLTEIAQSLSVPLTKVLEWLPVT